MKTMINKNKLIAEFMGLPKVPCKIGTEDKVFTQGYKHPKVDVPVIESGMQYKYSWDWLMPVIEKIETLGYTFEKNYQPIDKDWQSLIVKGNDILYQEFDTESIKASYYVVCELITELWEKKIGFKIKKGNYDIL